MKIRRLSEIDLARLSAIDDQSMLERALTAYNAGGGAWSYDPVRASTGDILSATTPLLGPLDEVPWDQIAQQIVRASRRGKIQSDSNVEVAKVLFEASRRERWAAAKFEMGWLPMGTGEVVRYWSDLVVEGPEGLFIPFFDHRRANGIVGAKARQVVYSMQHIWLRDRHPDLAGADLAIVRFPPQCEGRTFHVVFLGDGDLLTYEELNDRVSNVYRTWAEVSRKKAGEIRRSGRPAGGGS